MVVWLFSVLSYNVPVNGKTPVPKDTQSGQHWQAIYIQPKSQKSRDKRKHFLTQPFPGHCPVLGSRKESIWLKQHILPENSRQVSLKQLMLVDGNPRNPSDPSLQFQSSQVLELWHLMSGFQHDASEISSSQQRGEGFAPHTSSIPAPQSSGGDRKENM